MDGLELSGGSQVAAWQHVRTFGHYGLLEAIRADDRNRVTISYALIGYSVAAAGRVTLEVHDERGAKDATLIAREIVRLE